MATTGVIEEVAAGQARVAPLSVDQYHAMLQAGILADGDPIELIEGVLVFKNRAASGEDAMTHGDAHAFAVQTLVRLLVRALPENVAARPQLPVALSPDSEPEPDVVVALSSERHPVPAQVLLAVEVADSSLAYDRRTKLRIYAAAGLAVYWIVDIPERQIEVYEQPVVAEGRYGVRRDVKAGEVMRANLAGTALQFAVDQLLLPAR